MNKIQAALRDQILDTVKNIKKHKVGEILNWLLRNQIAKYSLANDYYFSTQFTLDQVKKMNLDVTKRSIKTKKNKITYEHPIPSKVVFDLILKAKSEIEIIDILKKTDYIVILSHYEDEKLRIKKAFKELYNLDDLPTDEFMIEKSKKWEPFRTIACCYLWTIVDDGDVW